MKNIYIIGIGGAGTSALALLYKARGYNVRGSDEGDGFYTRILEENNIIVYNSFDAKHIKDDIDMVVHTTAVRIENNEELQRAQELSLPIKTYPEAVGELTKIAQTIAVCGTHGKTTTTMLTAHAFIAANSDPMVIVGSLVPAWKSGAYVGKGKYFIIEADEYQNKLAFYDPFAVILTNIDFDHPDFFSDNGAYEKVFVDFVRRIPKDGFLVACGDNENVCSVALAANCAVFFYGEDKMNNCRIIRREKNDNGQKITVSFRDKEYIIRTQLFGAHNARNTVAAWLMSFLVTGDAQKSAQGIAKCANAARRFEKKGMLNNVILIDDYAHHPAEIRATLYAAQENYPSQKIVVAFHPHTFSRTEAFLDDFADALDLADEVIVLDIYASVRETSGTVSAQNLVAKINQKKKNKAQHIPTIEDLAVWMRENLHDDAVFLTLGAGDIWKVYDLIKK